ncbi:CoA-disulfide reductase [Virgibacillus siamensis]|uniref:CoA-disulfide reductase n=1 Tax=Virgibacillus siamensis TaxID=480071 RepID=UPI000987D60E|nr:CoA-disulfide reductase [Virgibacillus siamensis]
MSRKIVIVGGVGGGSTVTSQIRRVDPDAEIILFDKGSYIGFSNCGMPYYIGGVVEKRKKLLIDTEKFSDKFNADVRTNAEVTSIDRVSKSVSYNDASGTHKETYDTLIYAPGATAVTPDSTGINPDRTFTLRTIPDMDEIYHYIQNHQPKNCAIIGAGFIGMEMVENLTNIGIDCTIVDRSKQVMKLVDKEIAEPIENHLEEKGVHVMLEESLDSFSDNGTKLQLKSGKTLQADMTIMATGVKPNTNIAKAAGLETGKTGALKVNDFMQTNDPDIYALGDVVETEDFLTRNPRNVALAWPAHRQSFIIANHLEGKDIPYNGTLGSAIFKVFDLDVAATGLNRTALKQLGISFKEATHEALSHAGYYPGADKISLKVLFDAKVGTIYGAQCVGESGVDKRIAVISTAMKGKMTVADLAQLELAYAPPYSSPKDPVNILGYKASGMLDGKG